MFVCLQWKCVWVYRSCCAYAVQLYMHLKCKCSATIWLTFSGARFRRDPPRPPVHPKPATENSVDHLVYHHFKCFEFFLIRLGSMCTWVHLRAKCCAILVRHQQAKQQLRLSGRMPYICRARSLLLGRFNFCYSFFTFYFRLFYMFAFRTITRSHTRTFRCPTEYTFHSSLTDLLCITCRISVLCAHTHTFCVRAFFPPHTDWVTHHHIHIVHMVGAHKRQDVSHRPARCFDR